MKTIKKIIFIFLIWRIFLLVFAWLSNTDFILETLSIKTNQLYLNFPHNTQGIKNVSDLLNHTIFNWANFDGIHYLKIAQFGYKSANFIQAFFPVYPIMMRFLSIFFSSYYFSGLFISHISFIISLIVLAQMIQKGSLYNRLTYKSPDSSNKFLIILTLLTFPTAFYFVSLYTESLFLLLVLLTFYFTNQKKILLASIAAGIASATKVTGIFLLPCMAIDLFISYIINQNKDTELNSAVFSKQNFNYIKDIIVRFIKSKWKQLVIISLASLGLLSYIYYLGKNFNDPLFFYTSQKYFGAGRQRGLVLLPRIIIRYIKMFATVRPINWRFFSLVQEFILAFYALICMILLAKKIRISITLFSLLSWLLPTLTGNLSSMPRYILMSLPIYFTPLLFDTKKKYQLILYYTVSSLLLIINTMLFITGNWIS